MPKTRRAASGPTATGAPSQSLLSFKNRVTKSTHTDSATQLKAAKSKLSQPAEQLVTEEIARQSTPERDEENIESAQAKGKAKQIAESPVRIVKSPLKKRTRRALVDDDDEEAISFQDAEKQARKVSDAQVKKYWKKEEDARIAPRVHQQSLPLHEKILRHFDLCSEYGPCVGISRLDRWKRAQSMSLNPPVEVLAVLLKEDEKGSKRDSGRIAYVDELGGAKED